MEYLLLVSQNTQSHSLATVDLYFHPSMLNVDYV